MNYRHIYHAGGIGDVAKNAVLALLIERMKGKEKGFALLDTHAGCGLYDLADPRALKTGEAAAGIGKLAGLPRDAWGLLAPFLGAMAALNPDGAWRFYAGSPVLALKLLRPQDRLIACELHPEDSRALRRHLRDDKRAQVHARDGYAAIKAFLPFPEKRGLVFIDPPFETKDEMTRLVAAALEAHGRMAGACLALWYPIKDRPMIWAFHEALLAAGLPEMLRAEFIYREETRSDKLNGSGLVLVNAPWKIEEEIAALFDQLHTRLETEARVSKIGKLTTL